MKESEISLDVLDKCRQEISTGVKKDDDSASYRKRHDSLKCLQSFLFSNKKVDSVSCCLNVSLSLKPCNSR